MTCNSPQARAEMVESFKNHAMRFFQTHGEYEESLGVEAPPSKVVKTECGALKAVVMAMASTEAGPCPPHGRATETLEAALDREIGLLLAEAEIPMEGDPLDWWRMQRPRLPMLGIMAKKVLGVPASAVECERIFSEASAISGEDRNRIGSKMMNDLMAINRNRTFW